MKFLIKKFPEDFYVVESMVQPYAKDDNGPFHYYLLIKKNISTFDAVRLISQENNLDVRQIGYAGLKDEDGITTQMISSPIKLVVIKREEITQQSQFMRLSYLGSGNAPIKIGMLSGNSFRLIIRGLSQELTNCLQKKQKTTDFFINYYGPQRFGLPNAVKNTYMIGELLQQANYVSALQLLAMQDSTIGNEARNYHKDAETFFREIDERQLAFFLNSYESYKWNQQVKKIIGRVFKGKYHVTNNDGLEYYYLTERSSLIRLLNRYMILPYQKVFYQNKQIERVVQERNIVVPVDITCHQTFTDVEQLLCCELSFYLPTGCYATMTVDQILLHLQHDCTIKQNLSVGTYNVVTY